MKKTFLLFSAMFVTLFMMAQAPVPTSWDCSGTLPTGYTENDLNSSHFYTTTPYYVSPASAYKMDRQDEWLKVWVNDVPGAISYQIRGTGSAPWSGTVKLQESVDGTTWTDLHVYVNGDIDANAWALHTDVPASTTRYLRFYYTVKASGYNLGIDDINVAIPSAGPAQEISASYLSTNVPNNGTVYFNSPVGTATPVTINLSNLGTVNALNITSATLSGAGSADYSITVSPTTIAALGTSPVTLSFNPSVAGTRDAILTLANNDADENPFIINLKGIGGSYATEPASNPTTLSFSNIKAWKMTPRWTTTAADGYLVLRSLGTPVTDAPTDGVIYDKGQGIGSSKVFYVGNGDSVKVQEMVANTTYYYAVFAYNGVGAYTNYKQSAPTTGSQMSAAGNPGTYYSTVDSTSASFVSQLTSKVNTHNQIFYSDYDNTIITNFYVRDTIGDSMVVNCEYSGEYKMYKPPFDFTTENRSREHCLASSWMPTFGTSDHSDKAAYSDLHNLKFVNQNQVNAPRSNHAFGEPTTGIVSYLLATWGQNAIGYDVFSPRTDFRGDIARSLFYMSTCYNNAPNTGGTSGGVINSWAWNDLLVAATFGDTAWHLSSKLDQDLMKQWSELDPPSNEEIARNEYVASVQNNRNPFVDHPSWVCLIDFNTMSKTANCNVGIANLPNQIQATVYPNPTSDVLQIELDETLNNAVATLQDVQGKVVYTQSIKGSATTMSVGHLVKGMYILHISAEGKDFNQKIMID